MEHVDGGTKDDDDVDEDTDETLEQGDADTNETLDHVNAAANETLENATNETVEHEDAATNETVELETMEHVDEGTEDTFLQVGYVALLNNEISFLR